MRDLLITAGSAMYWTIIIGCGLACYRMIWQVFTSPVSAFSQGLSGVLGQ